MLPFFCSMSEYVRKQKSAIKKCNYDMVIFKDQRESDYNGHFTFRSFKSKFEYMEIKKIINIEYKILFYKFNSHQQLKL